MAYRQYSIQAKETPDAQERLLYITATAYEQDWLSTMHSHSFSEIFYVVDGQGLFCTAEGELPIQKHSLFIINPHVIHTEKSSSLSPLKYLVLGVRNVVFKSSSSLPRSVIHIPRAGGENIEALLNLMLEEAKSRSDTSSFVCQKLLQALLCKLEALSHTNYVNLEDENIPRECSYVKNYIDAHLEEDIRLEDLARAVHLNKFYLAHIFKESYGVAPMRYLTEQRILKAKNMLEQTDYSISTLAQAMGFSSANYFSQSFKKYTGLTPIQYRRSVQS